MKKLRVNIKDFYPNANYYPYLNKGVEADRPQNPTYQVGMLMYDITNNAIGMILGCIDEEFDGTLRLDSDGIVSINQLRFATEFDFQIEDLKYKTGLNLIK